MARRLTHLSFSSRVYATLSRLVSLLPRLTSLDLHELYLNSGHELTLPGLLAHSGLASRLQSLKLAEFDGRMCSIQWPRLTTLHADHFSPDPAALALHQSLPLLSSLYIDWSCSDLASLVASMEAGSLPRLTQVECTREVGVKASVEE